MAFPTHNAQQETNRKILEDIQIKKQLLQKGVSPVAVSGISSINILSNPSPVPQMSQTQHAAPSSTTEFIPNTTASRGTPFNISNTPAFGFFIPQESFYGNSFIPVLPRLDPSPQNSQQQK